MKGVTEKELKNYYSGISRLALCSRRHKREFLLQLKENVADFIAEYPEATMEEIVQVFGSPESIAESITVNIDKEEIFRQIRMKRLLVFAVAAAIIIYALFAIISLIDVHTEAHGYFEEGILAVGRIIKGGEVL